MHWREHFELLCDTQALLRRAVNAMEEAYHNASTNTRANLLLAIEFDEIIITLRELIEKYQEGRLVNRTLLLRFEYYLYNTRESIGYQHITFFAKE